jgi:hypothetical protein
MSRLSVANVPLGNHSPELSADNLPDDPRVHLPLAIVAWRRDEKLREQPGLDGIVILDEGAVRNGGAVVLDGLEDGPSYQPDVPTRRAAAMYRPPSS